jgi:hypothetical protein
MQHAGVLDALKILEPQTVIRWHRAGFPSLLALEITTARWRRNKRPPLLSSKSVGVPFRGCANPVKRPDLP